MLGSQLQNIDSASTTTFDVSGAKRTASGAAGAARRAPLDASAVGASQAMIVRTKLQARASAASKPAETTATFRSSPASLGLLRPDLPGKGFRTSIQILHVCFMLRVRSV